MWGIISSVFLAVYGLVSFYIGRRGWEVVQSSGRLYRGIYFVCYAVLVGLFPVTELGQNLIPKGSGSWLTLSGWYTMLAVIYLFLFLLLIDFVRFLDRHLWFLPQAIRENKATPRVLFGLTILLVIFTLAYGTWNAQNTVITPYEISVDKRANSLNTLRVAMVSDIHFGSLLSSGRTLRLAEQINSLNPDLIVIDGDLVDGSVSQGELQQLVKDLKGLKAKYGVFAVPGNHDRWARDNRQLQLFQDAGIKVLKDETVKVADSFYVIGRDNPGYGRANGRKGLGDLLKGVNPSLPLILLDHQPLELDQAQQNKIDLQLAGHTHRGQIFPGNIVTSLIYQLDWGLLTKGPYHLIVSSGYGTWGPPLRIGTHSEIVSVTLNLKS